MQWGTVPDWLVAVSTFLGFGFGLVLLRRQLAGLREIDAQRRLQYARNVSVSAWIVPENGSLALNITNHSPGPIYGCKIRVVGAGNKILRRYEYEAVAPTGQYKGDDPPTEKIDHTEMEFTDPNGVRWLLMSSGHLTEVRNS